MQPEESFENRVVKHCPELAQFIQVGATDFPPLSSVKHGNVFVRAVWSGPSVASLRRLANRLSSVSLEGLQFFVFSSDYLDKRLLDEYGTFPSSGGWGECFWIEEGTIVHCDGGYHKENGEELVSARIEEFFNH